MKVILAAALTAAFPAAVADAGSYTGNWPMTISDSQNYNGGHCVALSDDGSAGWPHSGAAELDGKLNGRFQVIGSLLMVTIDDQGAYMNADSVFSAMANDGKLGKGAFEEMYDGSALNSGKLVFGARGGC